jgi:hypothetical protein
MSQTHHIQQERLVRLSAGGDVSENRIRRGTRCLYPLNRRMEKLRRPPSAPNKTLQSRVLRGHGQITSDRRTMTSGRTALAQGSAQAQGRHASRARPGAAHRHPVCAQDVHPLGDAAPGDGKRLGNDLLATPKGVARGRRVEAPALGAARPPPGETDEIDWSRASLDSASVPVPGGAKRKARCRDGP